jgi:hypothetical protein
MKARDFPITAALLLSFLSFAVGCGGSIDGGGSSSAAGSTIPGGPANTSAPALAVDASIARVALARGFLGAPPGCFGGVGGPLSMTYDRGTREATWSACDAAQGASADSARALTATEASALEGALAKITYVEAPACAGYDGRIQTMTTSTASGAEQLYVDQNINCYTDGRRGAPLLVEAFDLLASMRSK